MIQVQPICKVYYSEFDKGIYFSLKVLLCLWVSPKTYYLKKMYYKKQISSYYNFDVQ